IVDDSFNGDTFFFSTAGITVGSSLLGRTDYVTQTVTFGGSGTPSTMVMSGNAVTVTLGTAAPANKVTQAAGTGIMTWRNLSSQYDRAGNAPNPVLKTESGGADC